MGCIEEWNGLDSARKIAKAKRKRNRRRKRSGLRLVPKEPRTEIEKQPPASKTKLGQTRLRSDLQAYRFSKDSCVCVSRDFQSPNRPSVISYQPIRRLKVDSARGAPSPIPLAPFPVVSRAPPPHAFLVPTLAVSKSK